MQRLSTEQFSTGEVLRSQAKVMSGSIWQCNGDAKYGVVMQWQCDVRLDAAIAERGKAVRRLSEE